MSLQEARPIGFTLIEMMIVVAIIGVLAVIAGTAYRKYMDSGRAAEVYSMLGEFRIKEEAYRAENGGYLQSDTGNVETTFYPALGAAHTEPKAKTWTPGQPANWTSLGINPTKNQLYCGYVVVTQGAGSSPAGNYGKSFVAVAPTVAYWYAVATCDNDGDGNTSHNAYYVTSSQTNTVYAENVHW
jgi:prepilin-type N-terminal cleavage/methylation domain-containing protein